MALGTESTFPCWSMTEQSWPMATGSRSRRLSFARLLVSLVSRLGWLLASQLISPGTWTPGSDRKG